MSTRPPLRALKAVPPAQGKDGEGLAAYAKSIGKSKQYIGQLYAAAEVASSLVNPSIQVMSKAKHLYARQLGRAHQGISVARDAAEVANETRNPVAGLGVKHLAAIHAAPRDAAHRQALDKRDAAQRERERQQRDAGNTAGPR